MNFHSRFVLYNLEKKLSDQLRTISSEGREQMYAKVYRGFFDMAKQIEGWEGDAEIKENAAKELQKLNLLRHLVHPNTTFIEFGAGDCALALAVARFAGYVYATETTNMLPNNVALPSNFELILVPLQENLLKRESMDLAYSNQFIEHLHPDDAKEHIKKVYLLLRMGGRYLCMTPNKLTGPHDISRYFTSTPTGFHLKEYSFKELIKLFRDNGFSELITYIGGKGYYMRCNINVVLFIERLFSKLPLKIRQNFPLGGVLNVRIMGVK
ncbi:MAG: class I SAM-dependent methyltransferase [Patescibacteria group bacterium]